MPNGIFINPKDVMKIKGQTTYSGAWRYLQRIAKQKNLPVSNITVDDFAQHLNIKKDYLLKELSA